ncbi:hypothetical protein [Streptomyces sp. NRRL WC-3725]|uniref:hypothetical protein n=1 Tax=Streptomyces sp. NRRL WC-3725 TaxID=1463933 RepID=UPI0004CAFBF2|nr:hypothetical protein [Streptomyces sp. NRRL WC-3725]
MSLVRHVVAPPAGRTTATDPLAFDLLVNPDPLRVSPSSGDPATGDLIVVASLAAETPVECQSFTVTVRVGPDEQDLCSTMSGVTANISLEGWQATVNATAGSVTFTPRPGTPAQLTFDAGTGLTFQLMGLPVNQRVGLSPVDISASWRPLTQSGWQQQTTRLEVGKFPLGFHLRSFTAEPLSVPRGGSVTLRWDASAATYLALHYDGRVHPVTGKSSVTVHDMAQTTSFHLRAVAQDGAGSVERTLSLMVHVPDSAQTAGRIVVHGTVQTTRVAPRSEGDPLVFPQPLPTLPSLLFDFDKQTWTETYWARNALMGLNRPAMISDDAGSYLVFQPPGSSGLVVSWHESYGWLVLEEPFVARGADPAFGYHRSSAWCTYRDDTQVMLRKGGGGSSLAWTNPVPVPEAITSHPHAFASRGNQAFLAFFSGGANPQVRPLKYVVHDWESWSPPRQLPGNWGLHTVVAMAALGDELVCLYDTGGKIQVLYERSPNASSQNWVVGPLLDGWGGDVIESLSLLAVEDRLYCAIKNNGPHRIHLLSYDGTSWSDFPEQIPDRNLVPQHPTLTLLNGRLCLL